MGCFPHGCEAARRPIREDGPLTVVPVAARTAEVRPVRCVRQGQRGDRFGPVASNLRTGRNRRRARRCSWLAGRQHRLRLPALCLAMARDLRGLLLTPGDKVQTRRPTPVQHRPEAIELVEHRTDGDETDGGDRHALETVVSALLSFEGVEQRRRVSPLGSPQTTIADPSQTPQRAAAPRRSSAAADLSRSAIAGAIARPAHRAPETKPAASSSTFSAAAIRRKCRRP